MIAKNYTKSCRLHKSVAISPLFVDLRRLLTQICRFRDIFNCCYHVDRWFSSCCFFLLAPEQLFVSVHKKHLKISVTGCSMFLISIGVVIVILSYTKYEQRLLHHGNCQSIRQLLPCDWGQHCNIKKLQLTRKETNFHLTRARLT